MNSPKSPRIPQRVYLYTYHIHKGARSNPLEGMRRPILFVPNGASPALSEQEHTSYHDHLRSVLFKCSLETGGFDAATAVRVDPDAAAVLEKSAGVDLKLKQPNGVLDQMYVYL